MSFSKWGMTSHSFNPARIHEYLLGMTFPATKEDLLNHAMEEGADDSAVEALLSIPERHYATPKELRDEIADGEY